ncbi:hypothetical protein SAMN06265222_107156 [Neorhodopirellula lusitana]|uniref:Uncharacterized protein n=1 Tax=Neorhodopirellula lusitana TaxID=445327 RepID=A0ABY1QBA9_9BACT|nr:hypothetical protein SAMN06265222_107156 [Neorhodopirellula lusitana]
MGGMLADARMPQILVFIYSRRFCYHDGVHINFRLPIIPDRKL